MMLGNIDFYMNILPNMAALLIVLVSKFLSLIGLYIPTQLRAFSLSLNVA